MNVFASMKISAWNSGVALLLVACVGCGNGDGRQTVTGNVTFDDKPLESGFVSFIGDEGYAIASSPIENGNYRLSESASRPGITPGTYRVQIESWLEEPGTTLPDGSFSEGKTAIPKKYGNFETSGFTANVDDSHHSFDFALKSN